MLNINQTVDGEKLQLALEGRLDTTTAPQLEAVIKNMPEEISEIDFDLAELEYISSAGLRVLLYARRVLGSDGALRIENANEIVTEVFEVTGFSDILNIG